MSGNGQPDAAPLVTVADRPGGIRVITLDNPPANAISFALSASATVILLYFLLASEQWLVQRTAAAFRRPRTRALVLSGFRQAQRDIGLFISTMSLVNLALGVATGLALWLIGLPNPVLWGTTTAVLAFIPYLGPLLIAVLLLLAGSVTFGNGFAMLGPPAAFLVLHGIEANFLSPMIMGHRLRLSPVFVFLSVMVWGWLWGLAGAFIAVPLAPRPGHLRRQGRSGASARCRA